MTVEREPATREYAPRCYGGNYNWLCQKPLPYIDNYKTSTGVGLYQVHPISERYDRVCRPLPCHLTTRDPVVDWDLYLTTTALTHNFKHPTKDPATFAGNYVSVANTHLVRKFDEHIKHRPHNRNDAGTSTTTGAHFKRPDALPSRGALVDLTPAVECKARSDCLEVQPYIAPQDGGYKRLLDPLLSTTTMDYVQHSERRQSDVVGKKNVITYWDAEGYPRTKSRGYGPQNSERITSMLSTRSDPIYDTEQFAHRAVYRCVPSRVYAVPHKGSQSEHHAKFQLPLEHFASHPWGCRVGAGCVEYPCSISQNSAREMLTAPGMYCPESAIYGTGFPVKAFVDTGAPAPARQAALRQDLTCQRAVGRERAVAEDDVWRRVKTSGGGGGVAIPIPCPC